MPERKFRFFILFWFWFGVYSMKFVCLVFDLLSGREFVDSLKFVNLILFDIMPGREAVFFLFLSFGFDLVLVLI